MSKRKDKFRFIVDYFEAQQPDVQSELQYTNAYQLLVATMLAAQCTDKRVNMVTPALFEAYPTPEAVEKQLVAHFPKAFISKAHHWLLLHGRYVCTARKPHCEACPLTEICDSYVKP